MGQPNDPLHQRNCLCGHIRNFGRGIYLARSCGVGVMMLWEDEALRRRGSGSFRALDQGTHERINARHYPGTRQLCTSCDQPTGRCEDDSIFVGDEGPFCEDCCALLALPDPMAGWVI